MSGDLSAGLLGDGGDRGDSPGDSGDAGLGAGDKGDLGLGLFGDIGLRGLGLFGDSGDFGDGDFAEPGDRSLGEAGDLRLGDAALPAERVGDGERIVDGLRIGDNTDIDDLLIDAEERPRLGAGDLSATPDRSRCGSVGALCKPPVMPVDAVLPVPDAAALAALLESDLPFLGAPSSSVSVISPFNIPRSSPPQLIYGFNFIFSPMTCPISLASSVLPDFFATCANFHSAIYPLTGSLGNLCPNDETATFEPPSIAVLISGVRLYAASNVRILTMPDCDPAKSCHCWISPCDLIFFFVPSTFCVNVSLAYFPP